MRTASVRGVVGAVFLLLVGCSFDTSVAPESVIRCQSAQDCPAGWRCSPLRQVCAPEALEDTTSPVLSGEVSPLRVRAGGLVTVFVASDEPLAAPPELELLSASAAWRHDGGALEADGGYVFQLTAPPFSDEASLTVFARAEDRQANLTPRALLGSVLVDGAAPRLVRAELTPEVVAPGVPVFVNLLFSEPVARVVLRTEDTATPLPLESPRASIQHTFVPPDRGSRRVGVTLLSAEDVVGNVAGAVDAGGVRVDAEAPALLPLALDAGRYSAQPGFNHLEVPLQVAGATTLRVCVEGLVVATDAGPSSCATHGPGDRASEWTVVDTADGGTTPRLVLVSAVDEVGNRSQAATTVIFDFDAPHVIDSSTSYQGAADCPVAQVLALGVDAGARVRFAVDEPLGDRPLLVAPGVAFASPQASGALAWSSEARLNAVAQAGAVALNAVLVDTVGNRAQRPLRSALLLDPDPPAPFGSDNGLRYRRAPWGDASRRYRYFELDGPAGSFAPGAAVQVVGFVGGKDFIVTQTTADADGGLPPTELFPIDFNTLWVTEFDSACNRGPQQKVPVVEWVVSFNAKTPGSLATNPHRFVSVEGALATSLSEGVAREWGEAELAQPGGARAVLQGGAQRWYRVGGALSLSNCVTASPAGAEAYYRETVGGQSVSRRAVLDLARRAWLVDAVSPPLVPEACASRGDGVVFGTSSIFLGRFDGSDRSPDLQGTPPGGSEQGVSVDPLTGEPLLVRAQASATELWRQDADGGWSAEAVGDAGFLYRASLVPLGEGLVVSGCDTFSCTGTRQTWRRDPSGWSPLGAASSGTGPGVLCEDPVTHTLLLLGSDAGFSLDDAGWRPLVAPFAEPTAGCVVAATDAGARALAVSRSGAAALLEGALWVPLPLAAGQQGEGADAGSRVLLNDESGAPLWLAGGIGPWTGWRWRDGQWSQLAQPVPNVGLPAGAWNPALGEVLLLGADGGFSSDGGGWTSITRGPPLREGAAVAPSGANFLAFGGTDGVASSDTWLRYPTGVWRLADAGVAPEARAHAALAEVPGKGVYLFGGEANLATDLDSTPCDVDCGGGGLGLRASSGATATFAAAATGTGTGTTTLPTFNQGDTWLWSGAGWQAARPQVSPSPRTRASLVWDAANGRLVLVGGTDLRDTWWLDPDERPTTWRDWTASTGLLPADARAVYSPADGALLANAPAGTFLLLPFGRPAQRLLPSAPSLNLPAGATLLTPALSLATEQPVLLQLWNGERWESVSGAPTPAHAARLLAHGLQLTPRGGRRVATDFVELTIRYRP